MKLVKIVAEIRYEQSLLFDDARVRNDIAKHCKPKFEGLDYNDQLKGLVFFSAKNDYKKILVVQKDKIALDIDGPRDLEEIKTETNEFVPFVLRKLDVSSTLRIGVRAHYIDESLSVPEITSRRIARSFLKQSLLDFIGEESLADDIAPRLTFTKRLNHEWKIMTNIAYQQVGEAVMDPSNGGLKLTNIQSTHPLIDLDLYSEVPKKLDQINGMLKGATSLVTEYAHKLWEMED